MKVISLEQAIGSLTRHPGVLIGPQVTCLPGTMETLLANSLRAIGIESDAITEGAQRFRFKMDSLAARLADNYGNLRAELCEQIRLLKPSLDLPHLATAGWSACISLTDDLLFESALRNHLDRLPTSLSATLIDGPAMVPPERTVPIYKLLGNLNSREVGHSLAVSNSELLVRQQSWTQILRTLPDYMRESPLFVLGCAPVLQELCSVMGVIISQPRPNVSKIVFLKDDPILQDATLMALCAQLNTAIVDANLRELCAAIGELTPKKSSHEPNAVPNSPLGGVVLKHEQTVSLVPKLERVEVDRAHLPSLIDGLFRPASVDWQPFAADIDLRRSFTDHIIGAVKASLSENSAGSLNFVVARGEAGVGKTTLLKRAAFELASSGLTTIWCKRANPGWIRAFRALCSDLSDCVRGGSVQDSIVVFCDDPWGLRMDAADLMSCFEQFPGHMVFVFTWRNSDYFSSERMTLPTHHSYYDLELPYQLDSEEWQHLGHMLQKIGAVRDQVEADRELARIPGRNATDILCSLWYLVPETRSQLSDSLRDEYCRLGNVRESLATIAQSVASQSDIARKAYEYVTVTSNLDLGLPVEVLVRALQINYDEWIDMIVDGRPLWGLLYDESNPDDGDIFFRTRNEIVTRVLLDLVNGGVGHAGEFRVLNDLLRACDGGAAIYRNFTLDVLVRSRGKLQKIFTFEQGIELFDTARNALVYEDRLLEHHKGIWIDDVGQDAKKAYNQLEKALRSDLHPSSDRDAPIEHIHTSMASALVKLVKTGEQDRASGFQQVRDHLRQASSSTFFNAYSAHVSANLLFELAQADLSAKDPIALASIGEALHEIERALQLIGAQGRNHFRDERSITMLTDLQRRIVRSLPDDVLRRKLASQIFQESGSQAGFEAVGRALLAEATNDDKGSSYNAVQDYLLACIQEIGAKGCDPAIEFLVISTDLIVRWRIQRFLSVDWVTFSEKLRRVLENPRYRDDAIKMFYYGVALFHLQQITEANAIFAGLRRLKLAATPREIRCYYLGGDGTPQRMQGVLEKKHDYAYIVISDLQLSIPMRAPPSSHGSGKILHAYIAFALNGPIAVLDKPDANSIKLP